MTTQELTSRVFEIEKTVSGHTEKMTDACARLDAVEREQKEQGKLLIVVERLANGITNLNAKVEEVSNKVDMFGNRLRDMELEPGGKWKSAVKYVLAAIAGAALTYLLKGLFPP